MTLRLDALLLSILILCSEGNTQRTSQIPETVGRNGQEYQMNRKMCLVCEQFMGQAVEYLKENKTQAEVIDIFHTACLRLPSFRQQCLVLVDYYSPLFFLEVSLLSPRDFCRKVSLCDDLPPRVPDNNLSGVRICEFCHTAVTKVLTTLKDPKTELSIVEGLEKGCIITDRFAKNCQNLIFQYVPVVLMGTVRILERARVCEKLHVCKVNTTDVAAPLISQAELSLRDS